MPLAEPAPIEDASDLTIKAWRFLEDELRRLGTPLVGPVIPVAEFRELAEKNPTTPEERTAIVQQAELLFDHLYPHLPFKREVFSFVPQSSLFDKAREAIHQNSEIAFQQTMLEAFALVRDAHTTYGLPSPFPGAMAFLPFQLASIVDSGGQRHYVVKSVMTAQPEKPGGSAKWGGFGHKFFGPGAMIVRWSGRRMDEHVDRAAATVPGGNESAWFRRGVVACTARILTFSPFPFDDELPMAEIVYRPPAVGVGGGPEHVIRLPWGVARFPARPELPSKAFSMSIVSAELNRGMQKLHYRDDIREEQRLKDSQDFREVSHIPEVFDFQFTGGPRKTSPIDLDLLADSQNPGLMLGYLRIKSFNDGGSSTGMTERLVREARRILTLLDDEAPDGLVLDIRGNPGGDIEAAEGMLQMLTPGRIVPEDFHLANTDAMVGVLRSIRSLAGQPLSEVDAAKLAAAKAEFAAWLDDAGQTPFPHGPDPRLTVGRPLTDPDSANAIGQVYHGPVALLVDGATYSAADMFAAGFQDHQIGPILSVDVLTGGGGANVSNHSDLLSNLGPQPGIPIAPLPRDVFMRIAFRRCSRVGDQAGKPIEDFGVAVQQPDHLYVPNIVDDVVAGIPSLITFAVEYIGRKMLPFRVDVPAFHVADDGSVSVDVSFPNITELKFFLDGKPAVPAAGAPGDPQTFVLPLPGGVIDPSKLRIEGYVSGGPDDGDPKLVCVRNVELRPSADEIPEVVAANDVSRQRRRNISRRKRK